jgi:hypothetical protein
MTEINHIDQEQRYKKFYAGIYKGVKIYVILHREEPHQKLRVEFLPENVLQKIEKLAENSKRLGLEKILFDDDDPEFEISHNQYYELLSFQDSVVFNRSLRNHQYLTYLFRSLTMKILKAICRLHKLRGYSSLKKDDLIEFIILNLSYEEQIKLIRKCEMKIIKDGLKNAIDIILGRAEESLSDIQIDESRKEIELCFTHQYGTTTNFAEFKTDSLENPPRDCDCRVGSKMGFCKHFWIAFIIAVQHGFFKKSQWKLTQIPRAFWNYIPKLTIKAGEHQK